jgi:anti-anti-sigma regulatory factor
MAKLLHSNAVLEAIMLNVHSDRVGDVAVLQCEGRIVRSDAAFALRDAVTHEQDARVVVLDLTDVNTVEGGGLGMLIYLHRWARDHDIRLKLFNPPRSVRERIEEANSISEFDLAKPDEMVALLSRANGREMLAA